MMAVNIHSFFFPTVFKETDLHFHESQPGQFYLCYNKISVKYVCSFIHMTLRTVMFTFVFESMEFIILTLAMLDLYHTSIRNQSLFQYWKCYILETTHPTAQHTKYSESWTDQMHLLKCLTHAIYTVFVSNAMLMLKSTCLQSHIHRRTFLISHNQLVALGDSIQRRTV